MTSFDRYKELYQCNFGNSLTDVSATSYSQMQLRQKEQEHKLQKLFEFISIWKDQYHNFCQKSNAYSYNIEQRMVWSTEHSESGGIPLPKSEFYIDEFFNMILNKRAKFEIQEHKNQYNNLSRNKEYMYTQIPDQSIIISGNKFTIVGKDNNYRLDIKLNAVLICSMIVALSNNYIIYNWYSKKSRFKEFIENVAQSNYFIEFQMNREYNSLLISGSNQNVPSLRIDIDRGWLYFILPNEVLRIENVLHYNHLDELFGKDRTKPLTEEDLQLYSIVNEERKPIMYDFEY